jgi:hypothetical protein
VEIMDWVNVILTAMGLPELCLGAYLLVTGRLPRRRVTDPEHIRRLGMTSVLLGAFFLLQVVGYLGVRLDLFSQRIRGVSLLLALAVGLFALVKYRPFSLIGVGRR